MSNDDDLSLELSNYLSALKSGGFLVITEEMGPLSFISVSSFRHNNLREVVICTDIRKDADMQTIFKECIHFLSILPHCCPFFSHLH